MPFTPFHLGPAILIGLLLRKRIDFPTFAAASLIVDARATMVFFSLIGGPLHGFLHTFLFGSMLGILTGLAFYKLREFIEPLMEFFKLEQLEDVWKYALAGVLAASVHLFLDSILYLDIQPFYPFSLNPMHGLTSASVVYLSCMISLVMGLVYYICIYWSARDT